MYKKYLLSIIDIFIMELIKASREGDIEKVTYLLKRGVDVNIQNNYGCTVRKERIIE